MLTSGVLAAFDREMQKIAVLAETGKLLGEQARLAGNLLNPTKTVATIKDIYHSSSNSSPEALRERFDEMRAANHELKATGQAGHYVGGTAAGFGPNAKGILGKARSSGWLSNYAKYEGPDKLLKAKNMLARALPGQRGLLAATTLPTAYSSMKKVDEKGRARGVGERVLGTTGALTGTLATQAPSVMRSMGRAGAVPSMLAGLAGSYVIGTGLSRAGQYAGRKLDQATGMTPASPAPAPAAPQAQPIQNRPM
jgi:hypothetical protein